MSKKLRFIMGRPLAWHMWKAMEFIDGDRWMDQWMDGRGDVRRARPNAIFRPGDHLTFGSSSPTTLASLPSTRSPYKN